VVLEAVFKMDMSGDWVIYPSSHNPYGNPANLKDKIRNISFNMNKARELFLDSGFDVFVNIDSDIIVPGNTLEELLLCGADVAVGLYRMRQKPHNLSPWIEEPIGSGRIRELNKEELSCRFVEVHRFGFGCILVRRNVLEDIEFEPDFALGPDFAFAKKCQDKGFKVVACTKVRCSHLLTDLKFIPV